MRKLAAYADLLRASGDDPFVRWGVGQPLAGPAYAADDVGGPDKAVGFVRRATSGRLGAVALGTTQGIAQVLDALLADSEVRPLGLSRISLPVASISLLSSAFDDRLHVGEGDDWEWMWTESLPPGRLGPEGERLEPLDDARDAVELRAFLDRVSPATHATPGSGVAESWLGLRGGSGALMACGAIERTAGGAPLLSGIAVDPLLRGTGLGRLVTVELTRRAVEQDGVCTLGMFSTNTVARALYLSLGYRIAHAFASRTLVAEPPPHGLPLLGKATLP